MKEGRLGLSMICRAVATRKNGIAFRFRQNSHHIPRTCYSDYIYCTIQGISKLPDSLSLTNSVENPKMKILVKISRL